MKKNIVIIIIVIVIIAFAYVFLQYKNLENSPFIAKKCTLNIKDKSISGNATFEIENISNISFNILAYDLALFINGVKATNIKQNKNISFTSGEKALIDIPYNTDLKTFKGFDLVNFMTNLIENNSVDITLEGNLTVNKGFINKTIPVNYTVKNFKKN
jgi:LEA14-like dessication related protein